MNKLRNTFLTCLISVFLLSTFAQSSAQDMSFGPKGGLNFHTFYGNDNLDVGMRLGIHLGGFLQYQLNDQLAIKPELIYSLEGAQGTQETPFGDFKIKWNLHYFDIPLLVRGNMNNIYFEGGPAINLLVGGNQVANGRKSDIDGDDVNNLGLALEAGGGYMMDNGIEFGLRFDLGFTGIADDPRGDNFNNFGIRLGAAYHISQ